MALAPDDWGMDNTAPAAHATTPAMDNRDRYGFALVACRRCGGSGEYSWNSLTGSKCFGCNGSGWTYPKAVAAIVAEFQAARRAALRPTAGEVQPGDMVGTWTSSMAGKAEDFRQVARVGVLPTVAMRSTEGNVTTVSYRLALYFTDGTFRLAAESELLPRDAVRVDPAPYLERAAQAWTTFAKARARRTGEPLVSQAEADAATAAAKAEADLAARQAELAKAVGSAAKWMELLVIAASDPEHLNRVDMVLGKLQADLATVRARHADLSA